MRSAVEGYQQRYPWMIDALALLLAGSLLALYSFSAAGLARAMDVARPYSAPCKLSSPALADKQSLLIVLLDRSRGMTEVDQQNYSTSAVQSLADLWPGSMAVIPFSGEQAPILGPALLSDPHQRADLKQKIEHYPFADNDYRPLVTAMQQGLNLLQQQGYPAGSQVILIMAGNPAGTGANDTFSQEQIIKSRLIGQYCQHTVPVNTFGLAIDTQNPDGQEASYLLSDIAVATEGSYTNVTSPVNLAAEVISLDAQWQGLTFTEVTAQNGDFPVSIDSFAQQVSVVAFRSGSQFPVSLIGPDGHAVTTGISTSTDTHYQIDNLVVSGPIIAGTYQVNVGGDPNAQVYALVKSPLQVQLLTPTSKTVTYANKPVRIQAQFLNGNEILTPQPGQGQIIARVSLLVNGSPAGSPTNDVVLSQQANSPLFTGQSLVYNQPGQLHIEVQGTYQGIQRTTQLFLNLLPPLPPHKAPPPPPWYVPVFAKMSSTSHIIYNFILKYSYSGVLAMMLVVACFITYFFWIRGKRTRDRQKHRKAGQKERERSGG